MATILAFPAACAGTRDQMPSATRQTAAGEDSARLELLVEQLRAGAGMPGLSVAIAGPGRTTRPTW
jgi:hypothetical protein